MATPGKVQNVIDNVKSRNDTCSKLSISDKKDERNEVSYCDQLHKDQDLKQPMVTSSCIAP